MTSQKSKQPVCVVVYKADLPILTLLIKSITQYMDKEHPLWIISNDLRINDSVWYKDHFDPMLDGRETHYVDISEFDFRRADFQDSEERFKRLKDGWANQQILKIAIAQKLPTDVKDYLVLDCQNFLINRFLWPTTKGTPYRNGHWSMHDKIWDDLCDKFGVTLDYPSESLATPLYLNRQVACDMIDDAGGLYSWSEFFITDLLVSEFATYNFWAKVNNKWNELHEAIPAGAIREKIPDWTLAYLRDSETFEEDFNTFVNRLNNHFLWHRQWASINQRAWRYMTHDQYKLIQKVLKDNFNLDVEMESLVSIPWK